MPKIVSRDGTAIAYDRIGDGPLVILVGGAFSHRSYPRFVRLAWLLAGRFAVVNYDRRGRGDSGDTPPYAVERELEDLEALIDATGGSAYVWGMSSGGVLALRAAARSDRIRKLALSEPPFVLDSSGHLPPADFERRLRKAVAADRRSDAVRYFLRQGMGARAAFVAALRLLPLWSRLKAVAHTLPYDLAVMGDTVAGKPLSRAEWAGVATPTLVIAGEKSFARARLAGESLAGVLPDARYRQLAGQGRNVSPKALAPVLEAFFASEPERRAGPAPAFEHAGWTPA